MNLHNQRVQQRPICAPSACRMPKRMRSTMRRNNWNMANTVFYDCFWCNKFILICLQNNQNHFWHICIFKPWRWGSQVAHLHLKCADCGREGFYLRVVAWTTQYFALAETGVRQMFFFLFCTQLGHCCGKDIGYERQQHNIMTWLGIRTFRFAE